MNTRKGFVTVHIAAIIIFLCLTFFSVRHVSGNFTEHAKAADSSTLTYISVPISSDDTLWSIAKEYYTDDFGSIKSYIKEIKRCNSLSTDDIYAGCNIVVPVYISPSNS